MLKLLEAHCLSLVRHLSSSQFSHNQCPDLVRAFINLHKVLPSRPEFCAISAEAAARAVRQPAARQRVTRVRDAIG